MFCGGGGGGGFHARVRMMRGMVARRVGRCILSGGVWSGIDCFGGGWTRL